MSHQVANGSALDGPVRRVADDIVKTVSFSASTTVSAAHPNSSRTERATRTTAITDHTTDT